MNKQFSLACLEPGESAFVTGLDRDTTNPSIFSRLLDIGLIQGTRVTCVGKSPFGDPAAYLIRGAVIALRAADARCIRMHTLTVPVPAGRAVPV
ncbi:MAG: ferrous iron transport protein A [Clostridiales bacterium]|nr:ferrous iron transport protein A [Clostridiales bacterium]